MWFEGALDLLGDRAGEFALGFQPVCQIVPVLAAALLESPLRQERDGAFRHGSSAVL